MTILDKYLKVIDDEELFLEKLRRLSSKKVLILQKLFWDFVLEAGRKKNKNFSREDIVPYFEKTEDYQKRVGCVLPVQYCRGKICIFSHPECATRKLKGTIYILRKIYLEIKNV